MPRTTAGSATCGPSIIGIAGGEVSCFGETLATRWPRSTRDWNFARLHIAKDANGSLGPKRGGPKAGTVGVVDWPLAARSRRRPRDFGLGRR